MSTASQSASKYLDMYTTVEEGNEAQPTETEDPEVYTGVIRAVPEEKGLAIGFQAYPTTGLDITSDGDLLVKHKGDLLITMDDSLTKFNQSVQVPRGLGATVPGFSIGNVCDVWCSLTPQLKVHFGLQSTPIFSYTSSEVTFHVPVTSPGSPIHMEFAGDVDYSVPATMLWTRVKPADYPEIKTSMVSIPRRGRYLFDVTCELRANDPVQLKMNSWQLLYKSTKAIFGLLTNTMIYCKTNLRKSINV